MSKPKKQVHFHKYERFYWPSGKPYYKCMMPGCSHYLPIAHQVIGRESLCWGLDCNRLIPVSKEDVARDVKHPMCDFCKQARLERKGELAKV